MNNDTKSTMILKEAVVYAISRLDLYDKAAADYLQRSLDDAYALESKVFKVDVGSMSEDDAQNFIDEAKDRFNSAKVGTIAPGDVVVFKSDWNEHLPMTVDQVVQTTPTEIIIHTMWFDANINLQKGQFNTHLLKKV